MLDRLPTDLVRMIFDACGDRRTRTRVLLCSRKFREAFEPLVYRHNVLSERCSAARWAVLHCCNDAAALHIVGESVCAGMDAWALQFEVAVTDIFSRRSASTVPGMLRLSSARLSLLAAAVLKRRGKLARFLLRKPNTTECNMEKLLAPEVTTYLEKLMRDRTSSKSQLTPLHIASATGLDTVVRLILRETPTELNSEDAHGRTPLLYAVQCPLTRGSTIQLLLRRHIKAAGTQSIEGLAESLLEYCCRKGMFRLAVCFLHGTRHDLQHLLRLTLLAKTMPLPGRSKSRKTALIETLIEKGADPNGMVQAADADVGERPLLLDLALTSALATKCLLAIPGVDVNIQDDAGWTALSRLLSQNHPTCETAALLLESGADIQRHSIDDIVRATTFRTREELMTILLRRENTFDLFRLLYKHCSSHTSRDMMKVYFLASVPGPSKILARMSGSDIRAIREGSVLPLAPYFDFLLLYKGHYA